MIWLKLCEAYGMAFWLCCENSSDLVSHVSHNPKDGRSGLLVWDWDQVEFEFLTFSVWPFFGTIPKALLHILYVFLNFPTLIFSYSSSKWKEMIEPGGESIFKQKKPHLHGPFSNLFPMRESSILSCHSAVPSMHNNNSNDLCGMWTTLYHKRRKSSSKVKTSGKNLKRRWNKIRFQLHPLPYWDVFLLKFTEPTKSKDLKSRHVRSGPILLLEKDVLYVSLDSKRISREGKSEMKWTLWKVFFECNSSIIEV